MQTVVIGTHTNSTVGEPLLQSKEATKQKTKTFKGTEAG